MSMPFYVSPEQVMKDKADYARKGIARGRSGVVIQYAGGILFVAPNPSRALHKISEIYDRIAFAAVGRYNEYENLRKAGVTYADVTGYQFDRRDVTARGIANWYAQQLGTIFTESSKPFEVEIIVAEAGESADADQIYRITFDGSVGDEHGFAAIGGQADQVATVLKERYSDGMTLSEALSAALAALAAQRCPRRQRRRAPGHGDQPARGGRAGPHPAAPDVPSAAGRPAGATARREPGRRARRGARIGRAPRNRAGHGPGGSARPHRPARPGGRKYSIIRGRPPIPRTRFAPRGRSTVRSGPPGRAGWPGDGQVELRSLSGCPGRARAACAHGRFLRPGWPSLEP